MVNVPNAKDIGPDKHHETRVRRLASRHGYRVVKSRQRKHVPNLNNAGAYMLIDTATNFCVIGNNFDASLEEIEQYLGGGGCMCANSPGLYNSGDGEGAQ